MATCYAGRLSLVTKFGAGLPVRPMLIAASAGVSGESCAGAVVISI